MNDTTAFIIVYIFITTAMVWSIRKEHHRPPRPTWAQAIVTALKYQVYFAIGYIGINLFFEALNIIFKQSANFNL